MAMRLDQPILVIEDSDDDYEALLIAFKSIDGFANRIDRCSDGTEAIDYLSRKGSYSSLSEYNLPGLILLDLSIPGTHGMLLLELIKNSKTLSHIPTVILTNLNNDKIARECYDTGVNSFIVKPMEVGELCAKVHQTCTYWFEVATLPKPRYQLN